MKDPYIDPATGILRNKLGITDAAELARVETEISMNRAAELHGRPIEGDFDRPHLEAIHRHLFGDVYDWAGTVRTVPVGKKEPVLGGKSVDYPSPLEQYGLDEQLQYTFDRLAADNHLGGLADDPDRFAERFARHLTEIWECHAFREGNTRTTTAFFRQLADEAGYALSVDFPEDSRTFRDALVLAAARDDTTRLRAHVDTGLDLAGRRALGVAPEPTPEEIERAESRLAAETERRLEALERLHAKAMVELEARREAAREAHETRVAELASRPGRRKPNDRERLEVRALHRARLEAEDAVETRRTDFVEGAAKRAVDVRATVATHFPKDAALARRGAERRAAEAAEIERRRTARVALETEFEAASGVIDAAAATNLARHERETRAAFERLESVAREAREALARHDAAEPRQGLLGSAPKHRAWCDERKGLERALGQATTAAIRHRREEIDDPQRNAVRARNAALREHPEAAETLQRHRRVRSGEQEHARFVQLEARRAGQSDARERLATERELQAVTRSLSRNADFLATLDRGAREDIERTQTRSAKAVALELDRGRDMSR